MKEQILRNLEIKKLVYNGYGLAYYQGKTVFVKNAVPKQIVDAKVLYEKKENRL